MDKINDGSLTADDLQAKIDRNRATVYDGGNEFAVLFKSNRMYMIDKNGKIVDTELNYESAKKGLVAQLSNSTYGTEEKPYEINSIEDLLELSYRVNGITVDENGNLTYINTRNGFGGKFIVLNKNLNFKLPLSYEDSTRKDYGDVNKNGIVEELLVELTTGKGWLPIGGYGQNNAGTFSGSFNGNNYRISNLYINNSEETGSAGLFGQVGSAAANKKSEVCNLNVAGNIYCNASSAAGILNCSYNGYKEIKNCSFDGKVENIKESTSYTAGIVATGGNSCKIENCYCKGELKGKKYIGGIISYGLNFSNISYCYNESNISLGDSVGGIVANGNVKISNCYNTGEIHGKGSNYHGAGGILGYRSS